MSHEYSKHSSTAQLKVKKTKCVFGVNNVEFLGHVVSYGVIAMEDGKKEVIAKWEPLLTSAKEVRRCMGMVSYYKNFVPQLATIAEPLTRLTRKRVHME